jgi:hypothetical protein
MLVVTQPWTHLTLYRWTLEPLEPEIPATTNTLPKKAPVVAAKLGA